jgi:alcohol dehydrogenase
LGANVVAVDIDGVKLKLAKSFGAVATVNAKEVGDVAEAVMAATQGGAHVSIDALGHPTTCFNSIARLRKRGRHVQVGLMLADHAKPPIPMDSVISRELEIRGSHGMRAHRYGAIFAMMAEEKLKPERLVGRTVSLEESIPILMNMDKFESSGVTVVTKF